MSKRTKTKAEAKSNTPIAIVGMSALCPGDGTTDGFLRVIFNGEDWIEDVPESRFALDEFHDPDPNSKSDKTYCKRGAFIRPVAFDPMVFGIPPSALPATDSSQLLALLKTTEALEDAAMHRWDSLDRERISVIVGAQGMTYLQARMMARMNRPDWVKEMRASGMAPEVAETTADNILTHHPAWQELSFPGFLGNIIAGRVTNRMDLGGSNYIVDAACASSLAAMSAALNELLLGQCDLVLTGGVDLLSDIGSYVAFSKTMALSRTGDCRPFSKNADGTVIGEGVVIFAMRRLEDAERDGDQIYGVIRGHGTSSDGRGSAIYAPRREGQLRAMNRAYLAAGYSPETVGLVEAHGTGTPLGDATEVDSMSEIFAGPGRTQPCALGSVKSQIGHAKTAAGAAALFKVVSALNHKVLPPTLKADEPNPVLLKEGSPLYLNTKTRPWISGADHPRRASLSAFGFGGTNAHLTVEEYVGDNTASRRLAFPSQLLLFAGDTLDAVLAAGRDYVVRLEKGAALDGVARESHQRFSRMAAHRLAIVATDAADLKTKLDKAAGFLARMNALPASGIDGVFYANAPAPEGKIAFMFPGQGSQYVAMTAGLAMHFDEARAVWDEDARSARETGEIALHEVVFPRPAVAEDALKAQELALRSTEMAQPGLALASLSQLAVLDALGLKPAMVVGHSFGEVMALHAAGAIDAQTAVKIARRRGALMRSAGEGVKAAMTAITLDLKAVEAKIAEAGATVSIANHNAPNQVVISGLEEEVAKVEKTLPADGFKRLPVSTAFHSPIVSACADEFRAFLNKTEMTAPELPVYANTTAQPYGTDVAKSRDTLAGQIASTVRFADCVRAMYEAGARTFIEVGAGSVLTRLTDQCLKDQPHISVPLDSSRHESATALLKAIGQLSVHGVALDLESLWRRRRTGQAQAPAALKKHVVWVDSTMNRVTEGERLAALAAPKSIEVARPKPAPRPPAVAARPEVAAAPKPNGVYRNGSAAADLTLVPSPSNRAANGNAPPAAISAIAAAAVAPKSAVAELDRSRGTPERPVLAIASAQASSQAIATVSDRKVVDLRKFEIAHRHAAIAQETYLETITETHEAFLEMMKDAFRAIAEGQIADLELDDAMPAARTPLRAEAMPEAPRIAPIAAPLAAAAHHDIGVEVRDAETVPMVAAAPAPSKMPDLAAGAAMAPKVVSAVDIVGVVLDVIASKTGYPEDMLDDGLELEGDLGIDSIKRVEIFMALRERIALTDKPSDADRAKIGALKTIGEVIDFLQERMAASGVPLTAEPLPPATPAAVESKPVAPAIDLERIVLALIAEKTGYPEDMLEGEMELEGDLGIDSIRRVEIFMALRERVPELPEPKEADRAKIGSLKTIADVTRFLQTTIGGAGPATVPSDIAPPPATPAIEPAHADGLVQHIAEPAAKVRAVPATDVEAEDVLSDSGVGRFVVGVVSVPKHGQGMSRLSKSAPVIITPDENGVDQALANGFRARGFEARVESNVGADAGTVIFLGGLTAASDAEASVRVHKEAFLVAKAVAPRLSKSGGVFVTVQDTGGSFGFDTDPGERAWLGGLAGIAKTIAKCWPDVDVKAIDIERGARGADAIAAALLDEIFEGGPEIETGLSATGLRRVPKLTPGKLGLLTRSVKTPAPIDENSVILVSGGSRGVTPACLEAIARAHRPRFVLLGRTVFGLEPKGLEAAETEAELKVALLAQARAAGESPKPAEIGRQAASVLASRSAATCLARLSELGSEARYLAIDIRDSASLARGLAEVRRTWGPITGLIHAAGVLVDKLIVDKTQEQFASVFDTKVLGLGNLLEATREDPLKMICLFSSASAQFGNIGQIDYSAANEVLNKVALAEAHRRAGKCLVRSINWGPWDGGMISPELGRLLKSASIELISFEAGAAFCQRELASPHMYPEEVVALHPTDLAPFAGRPERRTRLFDLDQVSAQAAE